MKRFAASLFLLLAVSLTRADDWPQFLGPRRDGISKETGLLASWPEGGPHVLWQRDVGEGFSGPVVAGERVLLFHRVGDEDVVECLNAKTGKGEWKFAYPTTYDDQLGKGNGSRSTPTIAGNRVITLGAQGSLHCLDLETGAKRWSRELHKDYRVPPSYFGVGMSPCVEAGLVLVNVGAKDAGIVAFDLETGKEAWKATGDGASYSSPVVFSHDDKRLAAFFTRVGVVLLQPKTGAVHYHQRWRARIDASVNAATPIIVGDLAFFSTSYDTGGLLLKLTKDGAQEVWNDDETMSNHFNTCIHQDGVLFGFHGRQEVGPDFRCVDLKTKKIHWEKRRFGCGTMVHADGRLIVLTEGGELLLVEASPLAYRETARAQVFKNGPCRAQIALADGRLLARDQMKMICFNLKP